MKVASFLLGVGAFRPKFYGKGSSPAKMLTPFDTFVDTVSLYCHLVFFRVHVRLFILLFVHCLLLTLLHVRL